MHKQDAFLRHFDDAKRPAQPERSGNGEIKLVEMHEMQTNFLLLVL